MSFNEVLQFSPKNVLHIFLKDVSLGIRYVLMLLKRASLKRRISDCGCDTEKRFWILLLRPARSLSSSIPTARLQVASASCVAALACAEAHAALPLA